MKLSARSACVLLLVGVVHVLTSSPSRGDGEIVPPRDYQGSLEEEAQEAIIIFHPGKEAGEAEEDLILKIRVQGDAEQFAWIVPFPNEPSVSQEDPALFEELFQYVEAKRQRRHSRPGEKAAGADAAAAEEELGVELISRQVVGSYDVAIVRETEEGGLNPWLEAEGFQTLEDAEDILEFYRDKEYVFACIKIAAEALADGSEAVDVHPLRFSFRTGGRDGIYFPMKMSGLLDAAFDVNLYVFYGAWINDKLSPFGYAHRGLSLRYRDWDSPKCKPNAGKMYSLPEEDPFLEDQAHLLPTVTELFQTLHPGSRYYLTNVQAWQMRPERVRQWSDDLWLFPYYTRRDFVPYDARPGGVARAAWSHIDAPYVQHPRGSLSELDEESLLFTVVPILGSTLAILALLALLVWLRRRANPQSNDLARSETAHFLTAAMGKIMSEGRASQRTTRIDLAVVIFALVYPSVLTWFYFVQAANWSPGWQQAIYLTGKTFQFAFPLVWVVVIRRRGLKLFRGRDASAS